MQVIQRYETNVLWLYVRHLSTLVQHSNAQALDIGVWGMYGKHRLPRRLFGDASPFRLLPGWAAD